MLVKEKNWTLPELHDEYSLKILKGRHPIIEEFLPLGEQFVPNDLIMEIS
jgi:DNA mismatch repair protein MutS